MESKELLHMAHQTAFALTVPLMEDMRTAPLIPPTAGGNHSHWIVGHLLFSEGRFQQIMRGGDNRFEALQLQFGGQSVPESAGAGYPQYDDLLAQLQAEHQSLMGVIEELSEVDLDTPSAGCPAGFEPFFGTWRQVLLMRPMHWMIHRGQLADCRRAAGRAPLLA